MRKVKLLYVITKLELGGAQKQLLSLINRLDKERFEPFLFTSANGLLLAQALSVRGLTVKKSVFLARNINPVKDFLALAEIYFFIRRNNIEIVHTHSSKAGILGRIAARFARAQIIIHTVHGWPFNNFQPAVLRRSFIALERLAAKLTNRLVVVSQHDKQEGLKNNIGTESSYAFVRYGVDNGMFNAKQENVREAFGISRQDPVVTNISCFKPQKSIADFIRLAHLTCKKMPGVKFLLVGDGALRKKTERLISKLDLQKNVILAGWRNDIQEILSATDCLVLTSLWEGLPVVVLESMASARPVIVTHTGGVAEVVLEGKTGFLVPCRDMIRMSEQLIILLKNKELRKRLGEDAKNNLNVDFTVDNMAKSNQALYESLITKRSGDAN